MREVHRMVIAASFVSIFATTLVAQRGPAAAQQVPPPTPPPATKLEGFKPAAGSVMTIGYDNLSDSGGVSVTLQEMRDTKGAGARGLLVEVTESQYRKERSFIDADEIPELLKGLDMLLQVNANPTQFKMFEVRYTTRGELQLTAFNSSQGGIKYAIQAGRTLKASTFLGVSAIITLRDQFDAALQKLNATSGK